jgi:hypothetical protein
MENIFVNKILEENNVIRGIAVWDDTILKNIHILFKGDKVLQHILNLINNPPEEGFHFYDKFCQFIVSVERHPNLGLIMEFMDYQDNDDTALDSYLTMKEKEWPQKEREDIMELYHHIKTQNHSNAQLVLEHEK